MVAYGGCVGRAGDRREDGEGDLALGVASPAKSAELTALRSPARLELQLSDKLVLRWP